MAATGTVEIKDLPVPIWFVAIFVTSGATSAGADQ
jgi:hypothetical protein